MREIRFRAWDMEHRCWIDEFYINRDGRVYGFYGNYYPRELEDADYTLSQYTGLKDKNSKEIYEGDIFEVGKSGKSGAAWVIWHDSYPGWKLDDNQDCGEYNLHWFAVNSAIIGNIYENPDLIK